MGLLTFTYKNKEFTYEDHVHNATRDNERGVELAFAKQFLQLGGEVVEVGAVSPYYYPDYTHPVYDLSDAHKRAIPKDGGSIECVGKNVLSISTVEHFGSGAPDFIERVKREANKYLITFPLGYNTTLDEWARNNDVRYMSRIDPESLDDKLKDNWIEKTDLNGIDRKYGTYQWANTIAVIENFI